jgi:hypothetical protein
VNVLEDEKLGVDFKPLYQCIHIYTALESLDELRKSYQADRKARASLLPPIPVYTLTRAQAQSDLILPSPIPLAALPKLVHETTGFFVIEAFVLAHTGGFRAPRDVRELWAAVVARLVAGLAAALRGAQDPEALLAVKEQLLACMNTLEVRSVRRRGAAARLTRGAVGGLSDRAAARVYPRAVRPAQRAAREVVRPGV